MILKSVLATTIVIGGIGAATINAPEPGGLGDEFASLDARESPFDEALVGRVAEVTGVDAGQLARASVFGGTAVIDEGDRIDITAVIVPMGDTDDDGFAGVAINDAGEVVRVALFGTEEFDADRNGYWGAFGEQFTRAGAVSGVLKIDGAFTPDEIDEHADSVFDDGLTSGVVADATLYRHRYIMRENSARFTTLGKMSARGETPSGEWLRDWAGSVGWLHSIAEEMEPLIGPDAVGVYRESAETGHTMLMEAASIADSRGGSPQAVRGALRGLYRRSCQSCHQTTAHPLGDNTLYWDLQAKLATEVRTDMASVGMDLWGPRDGVRQFARDAGARVRAALLLLGETSE